MQIIFLGTSCGVPTKERNHSSIFLSYANEGILFDCGEGTQRQLKIAGIKPSKITKIIISHWHGDHILGIPGLIQTLGLTEYDKTLKIYGPEKTKEHMKNLFKTYVLEHKIDLEIHNIKKTKFIDTKDFYIEAYPIKHQIKTLGFRFIEKNKRKINLAKTKKLGIPEGPLLGKLQDNKSIKFKGKTIKPSQVTYLVKGKILAYIPDSIISENTLKIAQDADILISESTYTSHLKEKAEEHMHLTSKQAAQIASQANSKQLILTHFSTRYKDTSELVDDAKDIFPNVRAAKDFMKIKL